MKDILCPLCGKTIGRRIPDGGHDSGGLGYVAMYRSKYDKRRASNTWWESKYKSGLLCKTCARQRFPAGEYWVVYHTEYGKHSACAGGDSGDPWKFMTREAAEAKAEALRSRFGDKYVVDRREI